MTTPAQDDDSMGDFWRDVKAAQQEKRSSNRKASEFMLIRAGLQFQSRNCGAHLIVTGLGRTVDFWPGTGLWIVRGSTKRQYGVRNLIAALTPEGPKQ